MSEPYAIRLRYDRPMARRLASRIWWRTTLPRLCAVVPFIVVPLIYAGGTGDRGAFFGFLCGLAIALAAFVVHSLTAYRRAFATQVDGFDDEAPLLTVDDDQLKLECASWRYSTRWSDVQQLSIFDDAWIFHRGDDKGTIILPRRDLDEEMKRRIIDALKSRRIPVG